MSMAISGIKALAASGFAAVVLGGGVLLVGVSAPPSGAACVAPASSAVSAIGSRRAELTQILTPAGSALVPSRPTGLVALRQSLNEALGCPTEQVERLVPAAPVVTDAVSQGAVVPQPESKSPNCRIV